jgi:hypothetical protein
MWMRRHPPSRTGRPATYEPVYANSGALRAIAAGLSAEAAAAVAAVAPDLVAADVVASYPASSYPASSYPSSSYPASPHLASTHATSNQLPAAPVAPAGLVRLGFSDLSEVDVPLADPWARALLAVAAELCVTRLS